MPIFDDRFARQNRCEPPPEFPLASPYTGIVHLLSGPAPYALTQIHPRTSGSVGDAPKLSPAFTFIPRRGLDTLTLAYEDDSLVRVSRRVASDHYASIRADARTSAPGPGYCAAGYNTPWGATFPPPLSPGGS